MGPGWVGRLEARALLTDKIIGSAGAFADGCISFSSSSGVVHLCLPFSDKNLTSRVLGSISAFSKVRPGQGAVMAGVSSMLGDLFSSGRPSVRVGVLGNRSGLPESYDVLCASCQVYVFSRGWYMLLSFDFQEGPQRHKMKGTGS